jgi:hypothetical protein
MRRGPRARELRRLVLGRAVVAFVRDPVPAVTSSRRAVPYAGGGPVGAAAVAKGAGPTQTPGGARPYAAWAARTAWRLSTPATA